MPSNLMPTYPHYLNFNAYELTGKHWKQIDGFSDTWRCFLKNQLCLTSKMCLCDKATDPLLKMKRKKLSAYASDFNYFLYLLDNFACKITFRLQY